MGFADYASKSLGNDLSSQKNGGKGLKVDDKEPTLWNCEVFDSKNEGLKDNLFCLLHQRSKNCIGVITLPPLWLMDLG